MTKRTLNKKSLFQMGGNADAYQSMDPAILEIVDHIKERLDSGEQPQVIVASLMQQNIPQEQISGAFEQVGYDPTEMVSLMQSIDAQQQQAQQQMQQQMSSPNMMGTQEQPNQEQQEQMQFGGTSKGRAYSELNNNLPRPNYLPLIPEQGNILGAGVVLDDAAGSLFSGKQDSSGLMSGAYRDLKAKKARWRDSAPEYNKYKVTKDPNDPNDYADDIKDLDSGKLRTKTQYDEDVLKNSKMDFNTKTGKYEGYASSRPIDTNLLGKKQVAPFNEFQKKSTVLEDFVKRLDSDTAGLLKNTQEYPEGTTLGISPYGEAKAYRDVKDNPYYYNTMMGLNNYEQNPNIHDIQQGDFYTTQNKIPSLPPHKSGVLQSSINPTPSFTPSLDASLRPFKQYGGAASKPFNIHDYGMNANRQSMIPSQKYGGSLPKAQAGTSTGGAMSFDEWANANGKGAIGMEYQDQMDYEKYKNSFGKSSVIDPKATYNNPTIKKSTNFPSWMSKQLDRPGVNAYGKTATAGVAMANVANEMFKQGRYNDYDNKLRQSTMADKTYLTTSNPVNSRGMWDVNTGLAEPNNYLPYLPAAQYGGDQDYNQYNQQGGELDVDNETLMKLFSACADIQIL